MTAPRLVSIVGAGPGDPDLLTVRAARRLEAADVVLYDGLVPREILTLATAAEHYLVSRRPGLVRVGPADVVALIVEHAQRGQRVVRLRAGDPFVLARGAEEALGLVAAGVPFEVVPGLTTASAAATCAGIPLTHRGIASGFVVVSGHAPEGYESVLTALPPASVTVVALMGLAERRRLSALLIDCGWQPATPVAIVTNASQPSQRVWRGDLKLLGAVAFDIDTTMPGVVVIGEVVGVGAALVRAMRWPGRVVRPVAHGGRAVKAVEDPQEVTWQR